MKKVFCIALVGLHLLNVVGAYWLFYAIQQRTDKQLAQRLDEDSYAGSRAITIKLPLSYYNGSDRENYERIDGVFEYEGVAYRMVKQKFYKDTVYIVCYKDEKTIAVNDALKDYAQSLADNSGEKKSDSKVALSVVKDYLHHGKTSLLTSRKSIDLGSAAGYVNHYRHFLNFTIDYPPELIG
ncbi:hypothetical protein [Chryseolinea lacunae]|uniref:DUF4230 domain-containing protein n=1 Tax=Chryseolinea lacunae TaxID=2801331 RepID=A0ABS1KMJ0_9BACT|nr:hypothetical protein [Chryseolinea lacunae]MBL0740666.1 hypothetical protein [Chryseolinea lacunae]